MKFVEAREKAMEKRRETEDLLDWLATHCSTMSVLEILSEFKEMHQAFKVPVWLYDDNLRNVFCSVIDRLTLNVKDNKLSVVEAGLLAEMLLWPEVEDYNDCGPRFSILRVLEKTPCRLVLLALEKKLPAINRKYEKTLGGSHESADLGRELEKTRELILKCGGSAEMIAENIRQTDERKRNGAKELKISLFPDYVWYE